MSFGSVNYINGFGALHASHSHHGGITEWLAERFGRVGEFLDEVILHGLIDTVKVVALLFLTYLLMEFIEHKASDKLNKLMRDSGKYGPAVSSVLGAVPQCGFSAAVANLYTGRVVTVGTLVAAFVSTSDEMLPILISNEVGITPILTIIVYKIVVGMAAGFALDALMRKYGKVDDVNIDAICESDNCHCENGIFSSALHHTLTVGSFVLAITIMINALLFFVNDEVLYSSVLSIPFVSHVICALLGLIPNCAVSVALTKLCASGIISSGAMISGLCSGAGVGALVLFRMNKNKKQNLKILALLFALGLIFGLIAELLPFLSI